jgi:hypothetical protein
MASKLALAMDGILAATAAGFATGVSYFSGYPLEKTTVSGQFWKLLLLISVIFPPQTDHKQMHIDYT